MNLVFLTASRIFISFLAWSAMLAEATQANSIRAFREDLAEHGQMHSADHAQQVTTQDPLQEVLRALDTDGSGKVEKYEVEAFAKKQGMTAEQISIQFAVLDTNGDGELEADELGSTLKHQKVSNVQSRASGEGSVGNVVHVNASVAAIASADKAGIAATVKAGTSATSTTDKAGRVATVNRDASILAASDISSNPVVKNATEASPTVANSSQLPVLSVASVVEQTGAARSDRLLQKEVTIESAREIASRVLAESFARSASKEFQNKSTNEKHAAELAAVAKHLRGKAALIAQSAHEQTLHAAAEAARKVIEAAEKEVRELEQEAVRLEQGAAERRQRARDAMTKVIKAQGEMRAAMMPSNGLS